MTKKKNCFCFCCCLFVFFFPLTKKKKKKKKKRYVRYFGAALKRKGGFSEPPPPKTVMLKELIFRDFVSPGELKFSVHAHGISTEPSNLRVWKDVGTPLSAPASRKVF